MKSTIAKATNVKEYQGRQPTLLMEMIFDDLVTLLRFTSKAQKEGLLKKSFFFTNQIEYLDLMWHHFILHTEMYHEFCAQELGGYLHHIPDLVGDFESPSQIAQSGDELQEQMELLEKHLGSEFVNRIFFLYPEMLK